MRSSFESQIQHTGTEPQLSKDKEDCESQNCSDEKNNKLLPSVVMESPSGSSTNTQTGDGSSKAEQKMGVFTHQSGTSNHLSQVAVCLKCGDVGFPEVLVFCKKCQVYALHRYCLDGHVIFTNDVTWFCEDCEPKLLETYFHDNFTFLPSEKNASLNLGKNCITEFIKNNEQPQNIVAAKTMVPLSDDHSSSYEGLSQFSNKTEKKNKFEKECKPVSKDEGNTSEGSLNATTVPHPIAGLFWSNKTKKKNKFEKECKPVSKDEANISLGSLNAPVAHPIADPVWRGSFHLSERRFDTVIGLLAHMSTIACSKVLEETTLLPDVLCPDLLPRSVVWPKPFIKCGPKESSIALYFFPDSEGVERAFDKLVDDMISLDLSIRAVVENAELLVFPSTLLPIQCRRFQEKYYLWGVFREKNPSYSRMVPKC